MDPRKQGDSTKSGLVYWRRFSEKNHLGIDCPGVSVYLRPSTILNGGILLESNNSTEWSHLIKGLFREAEPYLKARNDLLHTQVAHEFALKLLALEGGERAVVEPAIILHDVGWSAVDPEKRSQVYGVRAESNDSAYQLNRVHEIQGAVIGGKILRSFNYEEDLIVQIVKIIERHDSGTSPESLEEKLVKDADKLWRFSKAGFWREIERQQVDPVYFYERDVRRRREWLFTPAALRIAKEELIDRKEEVERYVSESG